MPKISKILLVEDNDSILEIYKAVLNGAGYTVETAVNSDEALQKAPVYKPDLIFLDIMIPGKTGLEVLGLFRTEPAYGVMDKPIVMLTNLGEHETVELADSRAANKYVIKANITNDELIKIVKSFETPDQPSATAAPVPPTPVTEPPKPPLAI